MPKISVVMPVYNGEKYLRETMDSILNQTFTDFEFIIINDASKDNTEEIIKSYEDDRIVYLINEQNLGVAGTLNCGIENAKGEYIARIDADDIAVPERFQKQVAFMDAHPDVGLCGSCVRIFDESGTERDFVYSEIDEVLRVDMLFNCPFAHPSIMLRKSILDKNNLTYNVKYEKAEDYRMWYDMMKVSKGHNLQTPLLRYRHHQGQVTKVNAKEQKIVVTEMRKVMYGTLNLGTDAYIDVFTQICDGVREFSEDEYAKIRVWMKKALSADNEYDKKILKKILAIVNYNIYKKSKIKNYKPLSIRECLYVLRGI